jgi:hypothetical protein
VLPREHLRARSRGFWWLETLLRVHAQTDGRVRRVRARHLPARLSPARGTQRLLVLARCHKQREIGLGLGRGRDARSVVRRRIAARTKLGVRVCAKGGRRLAAGAVEPLARLGEIKVDRGLPQRRHALPRARHFARHLAGVRRDGERAVLSVVFRGAPRAAREGPRLARGGWRGEPLHPCRIGRGRASGSHAAAAPQGRASCRKWHRRAEALLQGGRYRTGARFRRR